MKDIIFVVSRLVPYKRIDLVAEAFTKLGLPLKIIGDGSEYKNVASKAGPTVEMLGRVDDETVLKYMQGCHAFLFPGEEDFGITPIEAEACGKPVIALGKGGALETVEENKTGVFFAEQTVESVADAVERFKKIEFDGDYIRKHAEKSAKNDSEKNSKNFLNMNMRNLKMDRM